MHNNDSTPQGVENGNIILGTGWIVTFDLREWN
jgi:hypothetical protein